jgi:hypothetical protein
MKSKGQRDLRASSTWRYEQDTRETRRGPGLLHNSQSMRSHCVDLSALTAGINMYGHSTRTRAVEHCRSHTYRTRGVLGEAQQCEWMAHAYQVKQNSGNCPCTLYVHDGSRCRMVKEAKDIWVRLTLTVYLNLRYHSRIIFMQYCNDSLKESEGQGNLRATSPGKISISHFHHSFLTYSAEHDWCKSINLTEPVKQSCKIMTRKVILLIQTST